MDAGIVPALDSANRQGAALIAAHPYSDRDSTPLRATRRIWRERELFRELIHRYELFNRNETFAWVAAEELSAVARGDVHRAEHLASSKTLLPCDKEQAAVVGHLRSGARAFLTLFALERRIRLPVAA